MIDVIIPIYNSKETLETALLSILFQSIKDKLKVYIIDDNSKENYTEIIERFKKYLNITYYKNVENIGAGLSRQKGIEISDSKYLIFLDSDDLFYTHTSLESLFNKIEKDFCDYVSSNTYDEKFDLENNNIGDLHGKIYRRSFLEKHDIKFNKFRYDEDNYFNTLVLMNNPIKDTLNEITYVYKNNTNSLTNCNNSTDISQIENYVESIKLATEKCLLSQNSNLEIINSILSVKINYLENIKDNFSYLDKLKIENWINSFKNMLK